MCNVMYCSVYLCIGTVLCFEKRHCKAFIQIVDILADADTNADVVV